MLSSLRSCTAGAEKVFTAMHDGKPVLAPPRHAFEFIDLLGQQVATCVLPRCSKRQDWPRMSVSQRNAPASDASDLTQRALKGSESKTGTPPMTSWCLRSKVRVKRLSSRVFKWFQLFSKGLNELQSCLKSQRTRAASLCFPRPHLGAALTNKGPCLKESSVLLMQ